ncbi:MAG: cytidylate kinase-like family protein [Desulfosarcinaceae bacterium]
MAPTTTFNKRSPGLYQTLGRDPAEAAGQYIKAWEQRRFEIKPKAALKTDLFPSICFSRQIGVGAVEIADILGEKINYRVADKLIIEEMASHADVEHKTVDYFDERYPGRMSEVSAYLFGEKSFIMSNYLHGLTAVLYALAMSEPTIFVGRGAYLLLPRERVLAVRIICTKDYRVGRVAKMLKISESAAEKRLVELDRDQGEFFKKLCGKKEPPPEAFDLLINSDLIHNPEWVADIVATAFRRKFGL